jgi:hypothetical protein
MGDHFDARLVVETAFNVNHKTVQSRRTTVIR